MRRKLVLLLIAGAAVIVMSVAVRIYIRHFETNLMEHKSARTTSGVVVEKRYVHFASDQTTYQDDEGRSLPVENWLRAEGQYRIFYTIDNFNQIPEGHRQYLISAELERSKRYGPRFTIVDKPSFDAAKIGAPVIVRYRWADDSKIEVILVQIQSQAGMDPERKVLTGKDLPSAKGAYRATLGAQRDIDGVTFVPKPK